MEAAQGSLRRSGRIEARTTTPSRRLSEARPAPGWRADEFGRRRRFRNRSPLRSISRMASVVVEPDEIAELRDGEIVLRRVRTGYRTKEEYDGLEYYTLSPRGRSAFRNSCVVEALHLTDSDYGVRRDQRRKSATGATRRDDAHRHQRRGPPDLRSSPSHVRAARTSSSVRRYRTGPSRLLRKSRRPFRLPPVFPITS